MSMWIVLLRGINVGGRNIVPMAELRTLLSGLGYDNVQSYIQSGNCVLDAKGTADDISKTISAAIEGKFGFAPAVMVLPLSGLRAAMDDNPFKDIEAPEKIVHFYFLAKPADAPDLAALERLKLPSETYMLTDAVFICTRPTALAVLSWLRRPRKNSASRQQREISARSQSCEIWVIPDSAIATRGPSG